MSLYFDGFIAVDLKPDVPQQVIDILTYMTRSEDYEFNDVPENDLFIDDDWRKFLQIDPESASNPGMAFSDFRRVVRFIRNGQDHYRHTLSFRRRMHDDVEFYVLWRCFLNWIVPYVETVGFVGYYRETYSLHPIIVYMKDGKVYIADGLEDPKGWDGEIWDGDSKTVFTDWSDD